MASLRVLGVSKAFGPVVAVRGASVSFEAARLHAVVGENGAGKSTLLKIAAGLLVPDDGRVVIDGAPLAPHTAKEALARGVAMVQQHFALVPVLTGMENVVLGAEPVAAFGRLDLARARAKVDAIAAQLGAEVPLDVPVEALGVGDRQRLEIVRALFRDARVLILDEPTAVLTPAEADALYATLRRLASGDPPRCAIVVTHKLDEVRLHADTVTVLRRGEVVESNRVERGRADVRAIADAMMGHAAPAPPAKGARMLGEPVLVVEDARVGRALRGVSLTVRAGEICGVAGVEGNGQRELVRAIAGLEPLDAGHAHAPRGAAVVHEDRQAEGLVLDASVQDNALLGDFGRFSRRGWLDAKEMAAEARRRVDRANVVPPDLAATARGLSGGNQQKVVLARALARTEGTRGARALVLAHPTRGVDLGAARAIHAAILEAAERGVGALVVSADLDELRALCDRILVMARGRIVAELPPTASDHAIGEKMLEVSP